MKWSVGVIGFLPSFRTNTGLSLLFAAFCIKHPAFNLEAQASAHLPLSLFASLQPWQTRRLFMFACRCVQHRSLCSCVAMLDYFSIELFTAFPILTDIACAVSFANHLCSQLTIRNRDY